MAWRYGVPVGILVLVAACGSSGASPTGASPTGAGSPWPSAAPTAAGPSPTVALPSQPAVLTPVPGLTASPTAAPGNLVVSLRWASDIGTIFEGTVVLDDGRVVWNHDGRLLQLRTSADGVAWVRTQLVATGLLDRSADYSPTLRPGVTPLGHGVTSYQLIVPGAAGPVTVGFGSPDSFEPQFWIVPREMVVLATLADAMQSPDTWIPADLVVEATGRYRPAEYLLQAVFRANEQFTTGVNVDVSKIAWPVQLMTFGAAWDSTDATVERCGVIPEATAEALVAAEAGLPFGHSLDELGQSLTFPWAAGHGTVEVTLSQLLPDQHDCRGPA